MGIGVMSMLGSAGTFATFTATTTNPNNTFAAGTLKLQDTTGFTGFGSTNTNFVAADPRTGGSANDCSAAGGTVGSACTTLLRSYNVATAGMEPGQFLRGTITVTNSGTLPATMAMLIENVQARNGDGSLISLPNLTTDTGAASLANNAKCASDLGNGSSPGAPGNTGQQTGNASLTSGVNVFNTCNELGQALRITVEDTTQSQCIYGRAGGSTQAPSYAPAVSATSYLAVSGTCDNLTSASLIGSNTGSSPVAAGTNNLLDFFGWATNAHSATAAINSGIANDTPGAGKGFVSLQSNGTDHYIFIPGTSSTKSLVNSTTFGGNLTNIAQWSPAEAHTFTVTLAFPETGVIAITDANNDKYNVGADDRFQGGGVTFDLVFTATQ